jgi:hypothetical protein
LKPIEPSEAKNGQKTLLHSVSSQDETVFPLLQAYIALRQVFEVSAKE